MTTILSTQTVDMDVPVHPMVSTVPKVSLIMPAYNEEKRIAECIRRATAQLDNLGSPYEIIVIDDGSLDKTRTEAMVPNDPNVKVVGYSQNRGKGAAIKYGVEYATGKFVVFIDSDADIEPETIDQYVNILQSYDLAIASKRHKDSRVSAPVMRRLLSRIFHSLVILLTGIRVSDTQSGLKAFRREALCEIMKQICVKRYAFDVELLTVAELLKLRVAELPVRITLNSSFRRQDILRMFVDLMGIVYRLRVIRWYQRNLLAEREYKPIIRW